MCRTFHLRGCYNYSPLYHLQYLLVCIISVCFFMSINAFPRDLSLKIQMAYESFTVLEEPSTPGSYSFVCPMADKWMQSCWKCLMCEDSQNFFPTLHFPNVHVCIRATDLVWMPQNTLLYQKIIIATASGMKSSSESQTVCEAGREKSVNIQRLSSWKSVS